MTPLCDSSRNAQPLTRQRGSHVDGDAHHLRIRSPFEGTPSLWTRASRFYQALSIPILIGSGSCTIPSVDSGRAASSCEMASPIQKVANSPGKARTEMVSHNESQQRGNECAGTTTDGAIERIFVGGARIGTAQSGEAEALKTAGRGNLARSCAQDRRADQDK